MPPILEITPEMVGPNRTDMTRAYLIGVMLWPDDPEQRREVMKTATALHMRAILSGGPAARDTVAEHVNLLDLLLDALPARLIREQNELRIYNGVLAGEFFGAAVMNEAIGQPIKLEALKAAMVAPKRRKIHPKANISRSTLDNTILRLFRPVGHLWAAFFDAAHEHIDREFPCTLARIPEFLATAEFFRCRGIDMKYPKRRDSLFRADEAWILPPGLPLPTFRLELSKAP